MDPPYSSSVSRAADYIREHYRVIETVQEVATETGESYHSLRSKFRREVGLTLEEYLIRTRLSAAEHLLLHSDLLVKEICWQVGYVDEASFGRRFREVYGISPLAYRYRARVARLVRRTLERLKSYV